MNQKKPTASTVKNVWELPKKQKKLIAKKQLENFFNNLNIKEDRVETIRIAYYYKTSSHGRTPVKGVVDETFTNKTLTQENLNQYIKNLQRKFFREEFILLEVSIPKKYYDLFGVEEMNNIKITVID